MCTFSTFGIVLRLLLGHVLVLGLYGRGSDLQICECDFMVIIIVLPLELLVPSLFSTVLMPEVICRSR